MPENSPDHADNGPTTANAVAGQSGPGPDDKAALTADLPNAFSPFPSDLTATHLSGPAVDPSVGEPLADLGEYELLGEIARGGMGIVYKARHRKLNRVVAVKVTRAGRQISPAEAKRFQAEAEAAAKLDHPHIVPIYEVGEHDGQPYFAMALVEGQSLAQRVAERPLPPREAAAFMRQVAGAVAYAHTQGIIHRDLKPGNILLDAAGQPRVTDFGLAKRVEGDSSLTQVGQVMGTPGFMPPEQAEARGDLVGPLADVYSLGATLYCLLTGRAPFQAASVLETLKQVVEREPVSPRQLNPAVGRDLDTICLRCLQKRPDQRYPSAADLAADLQRFLAGLPIHARPIGPVERSVRWVRRSPRVAGLSAAIVVVALAGVGGVGWQWQKALAAARAADLSARDARDERDRAQWLSYRSNIAAASSALQLNNTNTASTALAATLEKHRGWEWRHFNAQLDGARQVLAVGAERPLVHLTLTPDGRRGATLTPEGTILVWERATGRTVAVLRGEPAGSDYPVFSTDGRQLVTRTQEGALRVWDVEKAKLATVLRPKNGRFSDYTPIPDSARVAVFVTGDREPALAIWDTKTGAECARFPAASRAGDDGGFHVVSPDGKRLASVGNDNYRVRVIDIDTGRETVLQGHTSPVKAMAFSPDGTLLATGSAHPENTVRLWQLPGGKPLRVLTGHKNAIGAVVFRPDGKQVASCSLDQTARLWDVPTGAAQATLQGHTGQVVQLAYNRAGTRLATAAHDLTARLWDTKDGELKGVLRGHSDSVWTVTFCEDDRLLVTTAADKTVRVWDVELLEQNGVLRGHSSFVYEVAFSPDGRRVASAAWDGTVRLWDATTGRQTGLLRHEKLGNDPAYVTFVTAVAFSPDGSRIASATRDDRVFLWDAGRDQPLRVLHTPTARWDAEPPLLYNPAGTRLALGNRDGVVRLWDAADAGTAPAEWKCHDGPINGAAFSPDGKQLATGGNDKAVRLWDAATGTLVAELPGTDERVVRVAYSVDGQLLAAASGKTVRLWNVATRKEVATLTHGSAVYGIAFSPDGTRLASGCADHTIRLWDLGTRQEVGELRGHEDYVRAVAFSPDGTRLVSGSGDSTVRVWDTLSAQERALRTAAEQ